MHKGKAPKAYCTKTKKQIMKNFEQVTAETILKKLEIINYKQDNSTNKELSQYYLTQLSSIYDLAYTLFNLESKNWFNIEQELKKIIG